MSSERIEKLSSVKSSGACGSVSEHKLECNWVQKELFKCNRKTLFNKLPHRRKQVHLWAEKTKEEWLAECMKQPEDPPLTKHMGKRH